MIRQSYCTVDVSHSGANCPRGPAKKSSNKHTKTKRREQALLLPVCQRRELTQKGCVSLASCIQNEGGMSKRTIVSLVPLIFTVQTLRIG